jgi:hypothetical protein
MKCFDHQDRDAVGICKSCNKGLCRQCAADLGNGLACLNRCEDRARVLISFIGSSMKVGICQNFFSLGLFESAIGGAMLAWGLLMQPPSLFIEILGGIFWA